MIDVPDDVVLPVAPVAMGYPRDSAPLPPYPRDGRRYVWSDGRWVEAQDWAWRDTGMRT